MTAFINMSLYWIELNWIEFEFIVRKRKFVAHMVITMYIT